MGPRSRVPAGLHSADLGSGDHSVADLFVVNEEVRDLDDGLDLLGVVLGADNVLCCNVFLNVVSQGDVDSWDLNTDGLLDPFGWVKLEDVFDGLAGQEVVETLLGQNKDDVLVFTVGFSWESDCVESLVLIDWECSDNFKSLNINGPGWGLELLATNGQEFVFPVVGVVEGVDKDGLGGVLVQDWNIWNKSLIDSVVGGNTDMRIDKRWSLVGEQKRLLVNIQSVEGWGPNHVLIGSVELSREV